MSGVFVVDDTNVASINYDTPDLWFPRTENNNVPVNDTVTDGVLGARASFTYTGSAIEVVGIVGYNPNSGPPAVQFTLDGQSITTVAPNKNGTQGSFAFFEDDNIQPGQHTLEIIVLNATQQYPFALDAILYVPSDGTSATAGQSATTTVFLPSPTSTSSSSKSSGAPVGPIVGGVVGGLAVLIAAGIVIWYLFFRRRRSNGRPYFIAEKTTPEDMLGSDNDKPDSVPNDHTIAPVTTSGPGSQYQSTANVPPQSSGPQLSSYTPSDYTTPSGLNGPSSASGSSALGLAEGSRPSGYPINRTKAAEAGFLHTDDTDPSQEVDAPPVYTA